MPLVPEVAKPVWDYGRMLWDDTRMTLTAPARWDADDWIIVGGGAVVITATALTLDRPADRAVKNNKNSSLDLAADIITPFGASYSFGVLGAFYLIGVLADNDKAKLVAGDGLAASLIAVELISPILKLSAGRSRPTENEGAFRFRPFSGNVSFPSGHTMQAFAVGSVIAEYYEQPWVDVVSYGMATAVGMARVYRRQHYLSDVITGAIIGTGIGKLVVHLNQAKRTSVEVTPLVWEDAIGISLGAQF